MLAVPQRVLGRQDFGVRHVEHGPDAPGHGGVGECVLVDDRAARRVDEYGVGAHGADEFPGDQSARLGQQRGVHTDRVAAPEQLREVHAPHAEPCGLGVVDVGVVQQHLDVVRAEQVDHPAADEGGGQDADGAAVVADGARVRSQSVRARAAR